MEEYINILIEKLINKLEDQGEILNEDGKEYLKIDLDVIQDNFIEFVNNIHEKKLVTKFGLSEKEKEAAHKFSKAVKEIYGKHGTIKYIFTPTGIGHCVDIYSELTDSGKDITDTSNW